MATLYDSAGGSGRRCRERRDFWRERPGCRALSRDPPRVAVRSRLACVPK